MIRIGVIMYQTSLTKGQELVAQRMVKEFRRQGHEAFLITSVYQDGESSGVTQDEVKRRGGYFHYFDRALEIPVIRLSSSGASWPPRRISFEDFVGTLRTVVEELDLNVLITHSTLWNGPEEVVKFVKWRRAMIAEGAPFQHVVFCHMSHFQEPSDERYDVEERSYREAWNSIILPQIMVEADITLAATPLEVEYMKKRFGAKSEKIMLFPGGIEDEALISKGDPQAFRAQFNLGRWTKVVACLGSVEERKNALAVLQVARILSSRHDIKFVLAGRLEGDYGAQVMNESAKLPNVSVLGPLSEEDKASLIRASFVNLSMSKSEALGLAQLEFMLMGVPVVTSGVGGQSWIVRDGSNGVVLDGPDDVKGAAGAISRLASDPARRKKMSRNASAFASQMSMTRLIDTLSSRLETEVKKHPDLIASSHLKADGERVVEASRHGNQNVVATTGRLLVRSARSGGQIIAIPYEKITKIVKYVKAPWQVLAVGVVATSMLLLQRVLGLNLISSFLGPTVAAIFSAGGVAALGSDFMAVTPFLPFLASVGAFVLLLREGFLIYYGSAGSALFLPKSFAKTLRVAERLAPAQRTETRPDGFD